MQQMPPSHSARRHGFSLIELTIVLTVLGLLIGGVLMGSSLLHASELRTVITEYQRIGTAIQGFRNQYSALPGDFKNATKVWGKDATYCNGETPSVGNPGTCSGNGDSTINNASAPSTTGEMFRLWQHLALAGLIEGNYTGVAGPLKDFDTTPGINSPASRYDRAGWQIFTFVDMSGGGASYYTGSTRFYAYDYGNTLIFATSMSQSAGWNPEPALPPEDAWNIDKKLDDGMPGQGMVIGYWQDCSTSTSSSDYSGTYALDSKNISCNIIFPKLF